MTPISITAFTATSCIGTGLDATLASLLAQESGLRRCRFETVQLDTFIGQIDGIDEQRLPNALAAYNCRNNRLAQLALVQDGFQSAVASCVDRYGSHRIGVFLGTSTSGILETEVAYRNRDPLTGLLPSTFNYAGSHDFFSVAAFVRALLGLTGPSAVVSTACSSSAKALGMAQRLMALGLIDAAVVGGVDSLCLTTLYGFHSLQLTSVLPCRPFDANRDGISIGEAAAFVLLDSAKDAKSHGSLALLGVGESSDAYHLSAPHPDGCGARAAMGAALAAASVAPGAIEYINLHGTGTVTNDSAESQAVVGLFGTATPCSSTKGATGHALGAAGALEVVICALAITHGFVPAGLNCSVQDPTCLLHYVRNNRPTPPRTVLSNSMGFGGTNCAIIVGKLR